MSVKIVKISDASKIGKTISNKTAQSIMSFLQNHKGATATQVSKELDLPASTVHYNLNALVKASIIEDSTFHYSKKGKEVRHYTLGDQVIVIVPEQASPSQLRALLPGLFGVGVAVILTFVTKAKFSASKMLYSANDMAILQESTPLLSKTASNLSDVVSSPVFSPVASQPNFLAGLLVGAAIITVSVLAYWTLKKTIYK